jgi:hypothetical protein
MNIQQFNKWIKIDTVVFLHYYQWIFSFVHFVKLRPQRHASELLHMEAVFVVHWNVYAKLSYFFHTACLVRYGYKSHCIIVTTFMNYGCPHNTNREFKCQNHVNSGILWQCLVISYWPSGYSANFMGINVHLLISICQTSRK